MTERQKNSETDIGRHVDTPAAGRNMEVQAGSYTAPHTGWISKSRLLLCAVSSRRDGAEEADGPQDRAVHVSTRRRRREGTGSPGAMPYVPCKDHRWGGRRKRDEHATPNQVAQAKLSACTVLSHRSRWTGQVTGSAVHAACRLATVPGRSPPLPGL